MKKAIICFPKISNVIWEQTQFPTGVYKIRQYCRDKYDIIILDERLENDILEKIDLLIDDSLLCLGLSVMTGEQIISAIRISQRYHGRVKIVWGGVHPTILPIDTIREDYIDYVIRGDGEAAFFNLLTYLDKGKVEEQLFLSKTNQNLKINLLSDLNKSNIDFTVEPIRKEYFLKRDGLLKAFTLETSRGCSHQCTFCHNTILGHKYRTVDTDYVINSISDLKQQYEIDGVVFQEDNFFLDVRRVKRIVRRLIQEGNIGWKANSRISYFSRLAEDEALMGSLIESNCKVLQFGIESGSNRILKLINKKITKEEVIVINKKLARFNVKLRYNFVIGFPTETVAEIKQTIEFIDRLMCENPNLEPPFVNIYTPYPGTPIFDFAVKQGFIPPTRLDDWAKISWNNTNNMVVDEKVREEIFNISNCFLKNSKYLR